MVNKHNMTTQQDNQIPNTGDVSGLPKSVGKILGEAREQHGLSVFDVSNRIKFAPRQIEALEADDFVLLPEAAFVRGFVRSYARLLQLNPDPLLAALPSSHAQAASTQELKSVNIPMPSTLSARRHNIVWLAGALVVALSLAVFVRVRDHAPVGVEPESKVMVQTIELPNTNLDSASAPVAEQVLQPEPVPQPPVRTVPVAAATAPAKVVKDKLIQKERGQAPVVVAETKKPAKIKTEPVKTETVNTERVQTVRTPAKSVQQEAVRSNPVLVVPTGSTGVPDAADAAVKVNSVVNFTEHALRLEFDEDAWVEIKDGNDKVLVSRMHRAGSLLRVAGKSPLDVTIGNAKAVRLFDKGKKINLGRHTTAEVAHLKLK